jgi:outer membrane lipoprotein-sorting protein
MILVEAQRGSGVSGLTSPTLAKPARQVPATSSDKEGSHPLDPVLQLARLSKEKLNGIQDYRATLIKQERVGGTLGQISQMKIKVMHRDPTLETPPPRLHVYLEFLSPSSVRGREVIWVQDRNGNKLTAHEGGLLNVVRTQLDPEGFLAMLGNRYPIAHIGIGNLIDKLIEKGESDRLHATCVVEMETVEAVGDVPCKVIVVRHDDRKPEYQFHMVKLWFDTQRQLPLRYASYSWPTDPGKPPLLEEDYTYLDLECNVGLTPRDFDPDNPDYRFP